MSDERVILKHEEHKLIALGLILGFFAILAIATCAIKSLAHERAFEDRCMEAGGRVVKGDGKNTAGNTSLSCIKNK